MVKGYWFLLLVFLSISFSDRLIAGKEEKKMIKEADRYYEQNNYTKALPLYTKLSALYPEKIDFSFKAGVCYLFKSDEKEKSITYLDKVLNAKPKTEELNFYLGRAYHLNGRFDSAVVFFQKFLTEKPTKEKKEITEALLENCKNGKELTQNPVPVNIQNIGNTVNTYNSEYAPVLSSDESVLIFTYKGERSTGGLRDKSGAPSVFGDYKEDIFITYRVGDNWLTPESIGENINTNGHDGSIAVSADGQKLFIFKSNPDDGGDIYISNLEGETWSTPVKLKGEVNTQYWEGSISMSSDEKTIYFSSERPGGMGKRDIYIATLQPNGEWGNVKNAGSTINTRFDDDAPFIHPDGKTLHFSSKGHNNIGGYDIFRSELASYGTWSAPTNLGYPINTTEDDIYYVLSADGKRGYYSSGKSGGYGKQDIYVVDPGNIGKKIVLAMVNGVVTVNDLPVKANIEVKDADKKIVVGAFTSNAATGKYLINLNTGVKYDISFKVDSLDEQIKTINTVNVDTFMNSNLSVRFYTKDYLAPKPKQDSVPIAITLPVEKKDTVVKELTYEELVLKYGDFSANDLFFKVQIAAFEMSQNFNYKSLESIGKVEGQKQEDGITRFTIGGELRTLNETDKLLKLVKSAGIKDAFILCFFKGKKMQLKQLQTIISEK